jgi:response regulator RpfG family c-di-GMP phosphodiesterase
VADFSVGLCQAVDRLSSGRFAPVKFSRDQLRELRYASLLHDFGKVGVREQVLVKAKKLYQHELELIQWRFRYIQKAIQKDYTEKMYQFLKENGRSGFDEYEDLMQRELASKRARIDAMLAAIMDANEPAVMEEGNFQILDRISRNKIRLESGEEIPFLKDNELVSLSIRRGNLNQQERLEIESHVTHTYRFLIQIPWTADLRKVPDIARGHHEKLDGSGYPHGLEAQEIPLQTRMMTIADIYDALTAPDRPYKRSLGVNQALDILQLEAQADHVDSELLQIFIEARIFDSVSRQTGTDAVQLDL